MSEPANASTEPSAAESGGDALKAALDVDAPEKLRLPAPGTETEPEEAAEEEPAAEAGGEEPAEEELTEEQRVQEELLREQLRLCESQPHRPFVQPVVAGLLILAVLAAGVIAAQIIRNHLATLGG